MVRKQWQEIGIAATLLLTGSALMTANWIGVLSLDRIANLWPSAIILIGLSALASTKGTGDWRKENNAGERATGRS